MNKNLILNPYYLPGYKSGGQQQTVKNLVDMFGKSYHFYILTQNHDFASKEEYAGIETHKWIPVGNADVMYLPSRDYRYSSFEKAYLHFDTIYSCGLFSINSIALLLIHKRKKEKEKKIYIAPMGVFSEGAMQSKHFKKRAFLIFLKYSGMLNNVIWSFTSEDEKNEAERELGKSKVKNYVIAQDVPRRINVESMLQEARAYRKAKGTIRIVFISRICPKKNLDYCARILNHHFEGNVLFDIYGIKEDDGYWKLCNQMLETLPCNVKAKYCGEVYPEKIPDVFKRYDIFLFPSKGENYGHIIYEALASGCVPIISDTTPWNEIKDCGCGEVIPLNEENRFQKAIEKMLHMEEGNFVQMRIRAIKYAETKYMDSISKSGYIDIFKS